MDETFMRYHHAHVNNPIFNVVIVHKAYQSDIWRDFAISIRHSMGLHPVFGKQFNTLMRGLTYR
ncbi:hypothetical protein B4W74_10475 [Staphylococcus intermedius]|nr:hypothetical protein B5C04_10125 [Staphylococcus intermedius]PNZ50322.1 hypothetical protein CD138_11795 [Staphylococcus intermedius NCTC 11048]PCF79032.1 hypothetical protein B4W74_10475 [Staphylococcus intermedius]PCF80004.1 hypothetical protein B4W70_10115 [Staphylococcus intermedius]PCF86213.1 hypothetical protein B4W76_08175 [Staphylococcus intermedius]